VQGCRVCCDVPPNVPEGKDNSLLTLEKDGHRDYKG